MAGSIDMVFAEMLSGTCACLLAISTRFLKWACLRTMLSLSLHFVQVFGVAKLQECLCGLTVVCWVWDRPNKCVWGLSSTTATVPKSNRSFEWWGCCSHDAWSWTLWAKSERYEYHMYRMFSCKVKRDTASVDLGFLKNLMDHANPSVIDGPWSLCFHSFIWYLQFKGSLYE
jgi:hypothetical protein